MACPDDQITDLIASLREGNKQAESRIFSLVYSELKRLARGYLRKERSDHTLQATELVHEAYLRLSGSKVDWQNRAHFFRVAALAMRRILVDHARSRASLRKGGAGARVRLEDAPFLSLEDSEGLIEVDEALTRLAKLDPVQAQIVELRYFAGLSVEETAEVVECSSRTVKREWRIAQAWLKRELSRELPA